MKNKRTRKRKRKRTMPWKRNIKKKKTEVKGGGGK